MSTAKPFGSSDRSTQSQQSERSSTERPSGEGESGRSPYAPKRVRGGFVPANVHTGDAPTPPQFLLSTKRSATNERDLTDFADNSLQFRGDATSDDEELRRLEESVRDLQREIAAGRVRAPDASPVGAGLRSDPAKGHRRQSDAYVEGYRLPPSLEPEFLAPPPELSAGRKRLGFLASVAIASIVAAPIAYFFAMGESEPTAEAVPETQLASIETQPAAPVPVRTQRIQPPGTDSGGPGAWPENQHASQVTVVPRLQATPPAETPQMPPPSASAAPTPPPAPPPAPLRKLDAAEIDVLVKQGQLFIASGDFVTARMVFQRAAEAGNAVAALALGASYDPVVLASLGVRSIEADVSKARTWYQRAQELGAPEATRRLNVLANR